MPEPATLDALLERQLPDGRSVARNVASEMEWEKAVYRLVARSRNHLIVTARL